MHRLHAPVRPGAAGILARRQRSAADVAVDSRDDAVLGDARALDAAEAADAGDPGRGGHPGDDLGISEGSGPARLVTTVPAVLGRVGRACCLVEGLPHGGEQRGLVGLHGEQEVGAAATAGVVPAASMVTRRPARSRSATSSWMAGPSAPAPVSTRPITWPPHKASTR